MLKRSTSSSLEPPHTAHTTLNAVDSYNKCSLPLYVTFQDSGFSSSPSYDSWSAGTLILDITQGSYSLTEIRDIDPLELGTIFGNVGGFWGERGRCTNALWSRS